MYIDISITQKVSEDIDFCIEELGALVSTGHKGERKRAVAVIDFLRAVKSGQKEAFELLDSTRKSWVEAYMSDGQDALLNPNFRNRTLAEPFALKRLQELGISEDHELEKRAIAVDAVISCGSYYSPLRRLGEEVWRLREMILVLGAFDVDGLFECKEMLDPADKPDAEFSYFKSQVLGDLIAGKVLGSFLEGEDLSSTDIKEWLRNELNISVQVHNVRAILKRMGFIIVDGVVIEDDRHQNYPIIVSKFERLQAILQQNSAPRLQEPSP